MHLSKSDFKVILHFKIIENLNTEYVMLKITINFLGMIMEFG